MPDLPAGAPLSRLLLRLRLRGQQQPVQDTGVPVARPFKGRRFEVLDSFRGVAALGVAWFHYRSGWAGYLAVDFFLVLSGFVLAHGYLYSDRQLSTARFIGIRIARLYPLHLVTLLGFALTAWWLDPSLLVYKAGGLVTFFQQLTLTHNVGLSQGELTWNGPSWSISVEFWINIMFFVLISRRTASSLLLALSLGFLALVYVNTGHLDTTATNYYGVLNSGMLRCGASFLLGILTYRACRAVHAAAAPRVRMLGVLEFVAIALCALVIFAREDKFSSLDFASPFIFALTVAVFSFEAGLITRLVSKARHLGKISYSIYLNQITILLLLMHAVGDEIYRRTLIFLPLYTAVLLVVSHFTHKFIEVPMARALRPKPRQIR